MALNYPGPYEVRLIYDVTITNPLRHVARYNCRLNADPTPGDLFGSIVVLQNDDNPNGLDASVNAWVALVQAIYSTTQTSFVRAELWKYTPESFESDFISSMDIGIGGTVGSNNVVAGQSILTFRTLEGGVMKMSFMESVIASGPTDPPPYTPAGMEAIAAYVLSANGWFLGRDTSKPFARIGHYPGQNETLMRKRWRT